MDQNDQFIFMNESVKKSHSNYYINAKNFPDSIILPLSFKFSNNFNITDRKDAFNSNPLRIVSIGRAVGFKKYPIGVIRALATIKSEKDLIFEIYGDGELLDLFKKVAAENNNTLVRFMGDVHPEKIKEILKDAYLFIGMGYSIVEAAAAGIPAIQAIESTDGDVCYGFFGEYNGYEVGEFIEGKEIKNTKEIINNFLQLDTQEYLKHSLTSKEKSKSFDQYIVIKKLLNFFNEKNSTKKITPLKFIFFLLIRIIDAIKNRFITASPLDHK